MMDTRLIKMFGCTVAEIDNILPFNVVNSMAIKRGYIVEPSACTERVNEYISEMDINPNATFWKSWNDITSRTEEELFFHQLLHYMSTYGTEFTLGNGYVPNEGEIDIVSQFKEYKVIKAISAKEMYDKCMNMLTSGMALKSDTVSALCDYVIEESKRSGLSVDIDSVKNNEAVIYLCDRLGIVPKDTDNLFRYIIYVTTGRTMIINNKEIIDAIKFSDKCFDFTKLSEESLVALSSIFLRKKDLFLAFKHNTKKGVTNSPVINKLRRLAKIHHKPVTPSFWFTVLSDKKDIELIRKNAEGLSNFRKVAIMQLCLERLRMTDNQIYLIRNQKMFIRKGYKPSTDVEYVISVYDILRSSLVKSLSKHNLQSTVTTDENGEVVEVASRPTTIRYEEGISIALPSSEKSYIGNYPFGTTFYLTKNNYIGIYWRNEWGTTDYDLSLMDFKNGKIGWDASYKADADILFSGDMTNADPEASEIIYIRGGKCPSAFISVNKFRGLDISHYRVFFGQDNIKSNKFTKGYMVNPDTIKIQFDVDMNNIRCQNIAVTDGNRITLMAVSNSNSSVLKASDNNSIFIENLLNKAQCFVDSKEILKEAGFNIVEGSYSGEIDIDTLNLSKDSFTKIMS